MDPQPSTSEAQISDHCAAHDRLTELPDAAALTADAHLPVQQCSAQHGAAFQVAIIHNGKTSTATHQPRAEVVPPALYQQAVSHAQPLHTDSDPGTKDLANEHQESACQRACSVPQDLDPTNSNLADAAYPQLTELERTMLADLANPQPADPVLSGPTAPVLKVESSAANLQQDGGGSPRAVGSRRRKPQRSRHVDTQQVENAAGEESGRARLGVSDPEISGESDDSAEEEAFSAGGVGVSGRDVGSRRQPKLNAPAGKSSRYRGVYWEPKGSKWYSSISFNHKQIHLGSFPTEVAAAHAFDAEAVRLRGPNTYTNFPVLTQIHQGAVPEEEPAQPCRRPRRAATKRVVEAFDISEDDEGAAKPLTGAAKALVLLASVPSGDKPTASQRRPGRITTTREDTPPSAIRGQKRKRGGLSGLSPRADGTGRARSKFTGVYQQSRGNGWFASICVEKTMRYLGTFATEDEAARAFDQEAIRLRGPDIELNLPHEAHLHSPHVFPAPKTPALMVPATGSEQPVRDYKMRTAEQAVPNVPAGGCLLADDSGEHDTGELLDSGVKAVPRRKRRSAAHGASLAGQGSDEAANAAALSWGRKRRRNQGWADVHAQAAAQGQHNHEVGARQPPASAQDIGQTVQEPSSAQREESQDSIADKHAQAPSQPAVDYSSLPEGHAGTNAVDTSLPTISSQPDDHAAFRLSSGAEVVSRSKASKSIDASLTGDSAANGNPSGLWVRTQRQNTPFPLSS